MTRADEEMGRQREAEEDTRNVGSTRQQAAPDGKKALGIDDGAAATMTTEEVRDAGLGRMLQRGDVAGDVAAIARKMPGGVRRRRTLAAASFGFVDGGVTLLSN